MLVLFHIEILLVQVIPGIQKALILPVIQGGQCPGMKLFGEGFHWEMADL